MLTTSGLGEAMEKPELSGSGHGGLPTLSYEKVSSGHHPQHLHTAILIHGLMGAGKNLRSLARNLLAAVSQLNSQNAAGWQIMLVDLRNHGNSAGLEHLKPPHDIPSAARDIAELVKSQSWKWPEIVLGHSLGGKVALEFGESCVQGRYGLSAVPPKQLWVLDSVPCKIDVEQNGEVERVLKTIQSLPDPVPSRRWLVEHMMKEGFSKILSEWLGSNLKRIDTQSEKMMWLFDVKGIYDMYLSYRQTDYWSFLESPPKGSDVGIVRAENSDRWLPSVVSQLEKLVEASKQPTEQQGTVSYHVLEKAGHWMHVDNPDGLVEMLAPSFVKIACPEAIKLT